jgi:large subunit ribosomal protein L30e
MPDFNNDIRLAVNTGDVSIGHRDVVRSISASKAQAVIVAAKAKKELINDIYHMVNIANVKLIKFNGNSLDLGTLCGKPYPVSSIAVINPGNSGILKEEY